MVLFETVLKIIFLFFILRKQKNYLKIIFKIWFFKKYNIKNNIEMFSVIFNYFIEI